ncbi:MAG TPA: polysaccharide biosynthesis C-terminal domain-containing protein, partial [Bacilli bacterium]
LIDSSSVIALLDGDLGQFKAQEILGILQGRAQSLAGIPPILAIALSMSIVPVISSAYAQKNMEKVNGQASQALRIACLSGLPVVISLTVAARPINGLLFSDTEGTWIIILSTVCAMFQIMMMTSGAVLLGLGKTRKTVVHVAVGIGLKLIGSLVLASWWGIYGIVAATGICFIATMLLNFRELNKTAQITLLGRRWFGFLAAAGIMAGAGAGIQAWTNGMGLFPGQALNFAVQSMLICGSVLVLYVFLLILFRVVTREDLLNYPAPLQKAARFFMKIKK